MGLTRKFQYPMGNGTMQRMKRKKENSKSFNTLWEMEPLEQVRIVTPVGVVSIPYGKWNRE